MPNGLTESKNSFNFAFDKLFEAYPELKNRVACGLCGRGSQCLSYDDEYSRDHDFENGFAVWLSNDDFANVGDSLKREYIRLFPNHKENTIYGIHSIDEFIRNSVGSLPKKPIDWLNIPEHALLSAVNGEIFYDGAGEITGIREHLQNCPKDAYLKRISAHLALASQAGEYNFYRMSERGDIGSATLSIMEFCKHIIYATHAMYRRYTPFYKWQLRSLSELDEELYTLVNKLILSSKNYSQLDNNMHTINLISQHINSLQRIDTKSLGDTAIYIHGLIRDEDINALHLMDYGVEL